MNPTTGGLQIVQGRLEAKEEEEDEKKDEEEDFIY